MNTEEFIQRLIAIPITLDDLWTDTSNNYYIFDRKQHEGWSGTKFKALVDIYVTDEGLYIAKDQLFYWLPMAVRGSVKWMITLL